MVNKPAGLNTHAPGPYAGEGIYDWLRQREKRWANLAIIHRLDKETSGVMAFGKTTLANRSLTEQFTQRAVRKKYLLLTDRLPKKSEFVVKSKIARAGERYVGNTNGELAETCFKVAGTDVGKLTLAADHGARNTRQKSEPPHVASYTLVEASPLTGRTHQIRVHAAENGFPVLGDTLYGGTPFPRVCLHAAALILRHPVGGREMVFEAPVDFAADTRLTLRAALIDSQETNTLRAIHGASDGWPGWYVDRLGDFLLSQGEDALTETQRTELSRLTKFFSARGACHKILTRQIRRTVPSEVSPHFVLGEAAPERFAIRENNVRFELSFNEGYSVGLFLDQRDNRRRFLSGHVAAGFELPINAEKLDVLNCFAYTCGFSICAARAGARTTSLDLSKKYLEWGKRNFVLNQLDPTAHDFIYGDVFDWLKRLAKKQCAFDVVALDPPTFSQSKEHGAFRAEKDYGELVQAALRVLKPGGVLFASTNAADWPAEIFLNVIESAIHAKKRKILAAAIFPPTAGFSRFTRRTGLFENNLAANRLKHLRSIRQKQIVG